MAIDSKPLAPKRKSARGASQTPTPTGRQSPLRSLGTISSNPSLARAHTATYRRASPRRYQPSSSAGLFVRHALARHRQARGVTLTHLTESRRRLPRFRCHFHVAITARSVQCQLAYFFKSEPCDRTHCHLPSGIFTYVSAHRALYSMGLPFASVPLVLNTMVAIAVCPTTVICKS
jgi:hypothetical protein